MEGYRIETGFEKMDLETVHGFISGSYWAKNIPLNVMRKAMEHSFCFGVFCPQGKQVGFARMVTDYATFAYLADVFLHQDHRGKGLSKYLMEYIFQQEELQGLRRMILATADAHGLYSQYGFTPIAMPEIYMECMNPDVYQNT